MSMIANVAVSIMLSDNGTGQGAFVSQMDLGPYSASNSPGVIGLAALSAGNNSVTPQSGLTPNFFMLNPAPINTGTVFTIKGANADTGVIVSSMFPSLIPAAGTGGTHVSAPAIVINATVTGNVPIGWL